MVTARSIYNKMLAMLDNYTEDGALIGDSENADLIQKAIVFIDQYQKETWQHNKFTKQVEITTKPPVNQLGNDTNFDVIDFEGDPQYYPSERGVTNVQGYSVQVDGDCSITIQEQVNGVWTNLVSLMPSGINTLTTYKGTLTVSDTSNPVRMVLDGTTHYRHINRALYKYLYQSDKVPTYTPWVPYDLPDDFQTIDMVVEEFPVAQYSQAAAYKLENYRDFYYNINFDGRIRITYKPIPPTVTSIDDELFIDDITAQGLVYDLAAKIAFYENPDVVNYAEGRRLEMKNDTSKDQPMSAQIMTNFYQ